MEKNIKHCIAYAKSNVTWLMFQMRPTPFIKETTYSIVSSELRSAFASLWMDVHTMPIKCGPYTCHVHDLFYFIVEILSAPYSEYKSLYK